MTTFISLVDIGNHVAQSTSFSPEQKRALTAMLEVLPYRFVMSKAFIQLSDITTENERFFTLASLFPPHLPKEKTWQWNQSRCKSHFVFGNILEVTMCKLNTRRLKSKQKPPSYKIWAFALKLNGSEECNFVWCERGQFRGAYSPAQPICRIPTEMATNCLSQVELMQPTRPQPVKQDPFVDLELLLESSYVPEMHEVLFNDLSVFDFLEPPASPSFEAFQISDFLC
jgi:hypothetical protein